jgi:hypothetical protein
MIVIPLTAAAQIASASCSAAVSSAPVQALSMQLVVPLTNDLLLHKQALSVGEQFPRFALAMHFKAQAIRNRC